MHIPIPIPIGVKHVAAVRGAIWKCVSCAHCEEQFAYMLELEATGECHDVLSLNWEASASQARAQAQQNLARQGQNRILPVPCPRCGQIKRIWRT